MNMKERKPPQQEFERKFLAIVPKLPEDLPSPEHVFVQGYLRIVPLQERIRFVDGKPFLQYKGTNEYESKAIPLSADDAEYLLDYYRVEGSVLVRREWRTFPSGFDGLKWELHTFLDENEGIIEVEIEFPTADFRLDPSKFPEWVGPEVTDAVDQLDEEDRGPTGHRADGDRRHQEKTALGGADPVETPAQAPGEPAEGGAGPRSGVGSRGRHGALYRRPAAATQANRPDRVAPRQSTGPRVPPPSDRRPLKARRRSVSSGDRNVPDRSAASLRVSRGAPDRTEAVLRR